MSCPAMKALHKVLLILEQNDNDNGEKIMIDNDDGENDMNVEDITLYL
jgi:hypothetical protein